MISSEPPMAASVLTLGRYPKYETECRMVGYPKYEAECRMVGYPKYETECRMVGYPKYETECRMVGYPKSETECRMVLPSCHAQILDACVYIYTYIYIYTHTRVLSSRYNECSRMPKHQQCLYVCMYTYIHAHGICIRIHVSTPKHARATLTLATAIIKSYNIHIYIQ